MSFTHRSTAISAVSLRDRTPVFLSQHLVEARKLPILLFDIMDTLVRDPFYEDVPAFFGMSMEELMGCINPTAWFDFEKGVIDEMELARSFFKDGRPLDLKGLKDCLRKGYSFLKGVPELLQDLRSYGYEIHAATNYSNWFTLIEERLGLSTYLSWSFCSCSMGVRKPENGFFLAILEQLGVEPDCCILIDDRMNNVKAARDAGLRGIHFTKVESLREELENLGIGPPIQRPRL